MLTARPDTLITDKALFASIYAVLFNVPQDEIWVDKHNDERHLFCVRRDNRICDGNMQFIESMGGKVLRVKKKFKSKLCDFYLIPQTSVLMLNTASKYKFQHQYIQLHDCFSQLLAVYLKPEQYEFRGKLLNIRLKKQDVGFLEPLFTHPDYNRSIVKNGEFFAINFDILSEFSFIQIEELFIALSADKINPISCTDFPVSYYLNRLDSVISSSNINHLSFGLVNSQSCMIISKDWKLTNLLAAYLRMKNVDYINRKDDICLTRRAAKQLMPTAAESSFEKEIRGFMQNQTEIIRKITASNRLKCSYIEKHLIIASIGDASQTETDTFIAAAFLESITTASIDATIDMCLKALSLKEYFNESPTYMHAIFTGEGLSVTCKKMPRSKILQHLARKIKEDQSGTVCYILDLYKILPLPAEALPMLKFELNSLIYLENMKASFSTPLKGILTNVNFSIDVVDSQIKLVFPAAINPIIAPLLSALKLPTTSDAETHFISLDTAAKFIASNPTAVFNEVSTRHKMVKRYHVMLSLFNASNDRFVQMMQTALNSTDPITFNEKFFSLGEQTLIDIAARLKQEIQSAKAAAEEKKFAELQKKADATARSEASDDKRVMLKSHKKITTNKTETAVAKSSKIKSNSTKPASSKPSTKTSQAKKPSAEHKHSLFSGKTHNLVQAAERSNEVKGQASSYDYDPDKHIVSEEQSTLIPELPSRIITESAPVFFQRHQDEDEKTQEIEQIKHNL